MKTSKKKSKKAKRAAKHREIQQKIKSEAETWAVERRKYYGERNRNLKMLGFDSYSEYLKSDLWASIRGTVLSGCPQCVGCTREASQVHHENYDIPVLLGEYLDALHPICGRCHMIIEFSRKGHHKLPPWAATHNLRVLADRTRQRNEEAFDRSWEGDIPPIECSTTTSDYAKRC
jgi:hypothetical protein